MREGRKERRNRGRERTQNKTSEEDMKATYRDILNHDHP